MIHIKPDQIKDFFCQNRLKLFSEKVLVAQNSETDTEIYLTAELNLPYFSIEIDGSAWDELLTVVPDMDWDYEKLLDKYILTDPSPAPIPEDDIPPEVFDPDLDGEAPVDEQTGAEWDLMVTLVEEILGANIEDTALQPSDVSELLDTLTNLLSEML